ncbi:MAG: ATP-binding protein [Myxococcota bacterium]
MQQPGVAQSDGPGWVVHRTREVASGEGRLDSSDGLDAFGVAQSRAGVCNIRPTVGDDITRRGSAGWGPWADRLPFLFYEVSVRGELLYVSEHWTRLTGQPISAALGYGYTHFVQKEDVPETLADLARVAAKPRLRDRDVRLLKPDGSTVWLRAVSAPVFDEQGVVVSFAGMAWDADQGAAARAHVANQEETLQRFAQRNEALLSALPDVLYQVSSDGQFLACQAPAGVTPALPQEAVLGRKLDDVLPLEAVHAATRSMRLAAETRAVQRFTVTVPTEDGPRDLEVRVAAMKTADFVWVARDVTEARRAEAELVSAREAALQASRLKTQFLANISHEIRTPLNGILGVSQLLRTMALAPEAAEYLDVLQSSGESLLAIVNDVLDLSKIEANRLELESTAFDFEHVVTTSARAFQPAAKKKGLELIIEVDEALKGPARGDPTRIGQIVSNLVSNAVKFTDEGKVRVLARRTDRDGVRLTVSDTGPGIPAAQHERIFDPFTQAHAASSRRYGGTGLGLTITRRLARLMGGDVRVTSAPGAGSVFEVTLSLPSALVAEPLGPALARPSPPPRPLHVLLAEDNELNAQLTGAMLQKLGHKVRVVRDGRAAVDALADGAFDLVLMDVSMPVLDGLEATRAIRAKEKGGQQHISIVALTANAMKGDDLVCLSAGMDAYLPKPVTVEALRDVLTWFGSQR